MILKNKSINPKRGLSLLEVLVVCVIGVVLSALAVNQFRAEQQTKRLNVVKSELTSIHQNGLQMAKKFQFTQLENYLLEPANANAADCFLREAGLNCTALGTFDPVMHTGGGVLSPMQIEENALLNGGFNLDGTLCAAADPALCAIQNITQMSFQCTDTRCGEVNFRVSTRINAAPLNREDKGILASVVPVQSLIIHDRMKEGGRSRIIASCENGGGMFGVNSGNGNPICNTDSLPSKPVLFDPDFGSLMQNGELQLAGGTSTGTTTTSSTGDDPGVTPECTPPEVLVQIKADGTVVCKKPEISTCSGELILSNNQSISGTIGGPDYCLVRIPAGVTVYVNSSAVIQAQEIEILGAINGTGRGYQGGNGGSGGSGGIPGSRGAPGTPGLGNTAPAGAGGAGGAGGSHCGGNPCTGNNGGGGNAGAPGMNATARGVIGGGGGGAGGAGGGGNGRARAGCTRKGGWGYHLEAGGGGGGGAGGRGGAAVQILTSKLTFTGSITTLGTQNGGRGGGGTNPPNAASVGSGGAGGSATAVSDSRGQGGGGGNGCGGNVGGSGGTGGTGGRGGDGSIYIEYQDLVGSLAGLNSGSGFKQAVKK